MIFHTRDRSFVTLTNCYARAKSLAAPGEITKNHALSVHWYNMLMAWPDAIKTERQTKVALQLGSEIWLQRAVLLDWMALKIDEFAKSNLISEDMVVRAILFEWKKLMFFRPSIDLAKCSK